MKSFKSHLREMYDTCPVDTKKKMKDVEEPLKKKGYPYNEDDEKNFKPHMMYDPKTGKGYKAKTYQDHLDMKKKGYGHDKPEVKEAKIIDSGSVTYQAKNRAEYQKLYGAAVNAMHNKLTGRGGVVGDRSKLTVKINFKDEKTRKKFEKGFGITESVELDENTKAFRSEVHAELKKVMDNKYYREFRASNGGQALENVINHFGKSRGYRVDKTVKSIIDKYGKNRDEYVKLSFQSAAKGRGLREEVELEEMSAKAHYNKMKAQGKLGGKVVTPIDRDRFSNREKEGLEGPYRSKKSGQIYYYDKRAGKYYDPQSDMYLQVKDVMESTELDEAKTITLVAKKGSKTIETVKKVTPKEQKTVEMLLRTAHGKDIKIEVVKESVELDEASEKQMIDMLRKEYGKISKVDPSSPTYKKLTALLDNLAKNNPSLLKKLSTAKIKFVSPLALNRVNRKKMSEGYGEMDEAYEVTYKPASDRESRLIDNAIEGSSMKKHLHSGKKGKDGKWKLKFKSERGYKNFAANYPGTYTHNPSKNESVDEKVMGALPGGSPTRKFEVTPSPDVKSHILQTKKTEFLYSADSVLGGNSKFVVISTKRHKMAGEDGVMMAIISNPDRGSYRKIFSYFGTHRNVAGAKKFAKNNKLIS